MNDSLILKPPVDCRARACEGRVTARVIAMMMGDHDRRNRSDTRCDLGPKQLAHAVYLAIDNDRAAAIGNDQHVAAAVEHDPCIGPDAVPLKQGVISCSHRRAWKAKQSCCGSETTGRLQKVTTKHARFKSNRRTRQGTRPTPERFSGLTRGVRRSVR
jgi:hypothetical protein